MCGKEDVIIKLSKTRIRLTGKGGINVGRLKSNIFYYTKQIQQKTQKMSLFTTILKLIQKE